MLGRHGGAKWETLTHAHGSWRRGSAIGRCARLAKSGEAAPSRGSRRRHQLSPRWERTGSPGANGMTRRQGTQGSARRCTGEAGSREPRVRDAPTSTQDVAPRTLALPHEQQHVTTGDSRVALLGAMPAPWCCQGTTWLQRHLVQSPRNMAPGNAFTVVSHCASKPVDENCTSSNKGGSLSLRFRALSPPSRPRVRQPVRCHPRRAPSRG